MALLAEDTAPLASCNFSEITQHTHDQESVEIVWWANVVGLPCIAIVGLACNLLNIAILTSNRAAKRIPSWNLLLALAVCDCFFLLFASLEVTPPSIPSLAFSPSFNYIYAHSALYIRSLASTFYKSSVLIVVAFNVERYVCVVHPLRAHSLCSGRASRLAVVACVAVSAIASLQWPICYRVTLCLEAESLSHFYVILLSDSPSLQFYYRVMDYLSLFGFNLLPIVAVCVMNTRLILTLSRVVDEDMARGREGAEQKALTGDGAILQSGGATQRLNANAMLFAVVLMLLVCVGPQAPARLLFDLYGQYHSTAIVYTCISQQLVFLNAALNFALYCVVSRRYRALMRQTVKRLLSSLFQGAARYRPSVLLSARASKSSSAPATSVDEHASQLRRLSCPPSMPGVHILVSAT